MLSPTLPQRHPNYLSVIQLSDLHLGETDDLAAQHFDKVLAYLQAHKNSLDLLVLTGDLMQIPNQANYDRLFAQLNSLALPYVAIPGNHDVTLECDAHLPFAQRRHLPVAADPRIAGNRVTTTSHWHMIFLDSSVMGQGYGEYSVATLDWLDKTLAQVTKPCIIWSHHPMLAIGSAWIDCISLKNPAEFWQVIAPYQSLIRGIFVGHVHQACHIKHQHIDLYTCPATSIQFKPNSETYALDDKLPGLRWLTLYNNGTLASIIKRIDTR